MSDATNTLCKLRGLSVSLVERSDKTLNREPARQAATNRDAETAERITDRAAELCSRILYENQEVAYCYTYYLPTVASNCSILFLNSAGIGSFLFSL